MAGFRFLGPLNQMENWLDVEDGTSARSPASRPGPVNTDGPPPARYSRPELWTPAERDALIVEQQDLWLRIKQGLEHAAAVDQSWKASEKKFAYLDTSGFQPLSARRLETAGERGPELYSQFMWKATAERRKEAFQSALKRIPDVIENLQKVDALFYFYDELCKAEFESLNAFLKPSFNNPIRKKGIKEPWEYYRWVRQFYFRVKIDNPAALLNESVTRAWFLGREIVGGVNPQMRAILKRAGEELEKMGLGVQLEVAKSLRSTPGGFVPRPIANKNQLSEHSLGQAVDFDPDTNPHVVGTPAKAIDEVLAWLQAQGLAGPERIEQKLVDTTNLCWIPEAEVEERYGGMKAISTAIQRFLDRWLEKWVAATERRDAARAQVKKLEKTSKPPAPGKVSLVSVSAASHLDTAKAELDAAEADYTKFSNFNAFLNVEKLVMGWGGGIFEGQIKEGVKQARFCRDNGMITLPVQLYIAMKKAGARAGLEYNESKDVMHFEVPPSR